MKKSEYIKMELGNLYNKRIENQKKGFGGLSGLEDDMESRLMSGWVCDTDDCFAILSTAEVRWCMAHRDKYNNKLLCMLHQHELGEQSSGASSPK